MRYYLREAFDQLLRWLISPAGLSRQKDSSAASPMPTRSWCPPSRWRPPAVPIVNDIALVRPYFLAYEARCQRATGCPLGGERS